MNQDLENASSWQRKGKKYKAKYFSALGQLFGDINYDKECRKSSEEERGIFSSDGGARADIVLSLVDQKRNKTHL